MRDLSLEVQQSSISEIDIAEKPDSTASEQIQNTSLEDDQDDITEDAIAASAVQPDKIVKDCCTAGNISFGEESNSAVKIQNRVRVL